MTRENPEALISDEVLVQQAREGDSRAFDALVLRYQAQAVSLAHSILRDWEMAKDASQNAFAKAYFGLRHFRGEASFRTWLIRIIWNEAKGLARKERITGVFRFWKGVEGVEEGLASILEFVPSREKSPEGAVEEKELRERVEQAIGKLPPREQEVFILRYFQDLKLREIAEVTGRALGTVKAHLAHATEKVKLMLVKEGV